MKNFRPFNTLQYEFIDSVRYYVQILREEGRKNLRKLKLKLPILQFFSVYSDFFLHFFYKFHIVSALNSKIVLSEFLYWFQPKGISILERSDDLIVLVK